VKSSEQKGVMYISARNVLRGSRPKGQSKQSETIDNFMQLFCN